MTKKNTPSLSERIPTAREMADSPPALAHIKLNNKSKTARLVYDHKPGWPQPGEPLTGKWGATVAAKALRCGQPKPVAEYLRTNETISCDVRRILADMLDPPPGCTEPRRLEFKYEKKTALMGHHLRRLELIGAHAKMLMQNGGEKVTAEVRQTKQDLGVSESEIYKSLRFLKDRTIEEFSDNLCDNAWSKRFDKKYGLKGSAMARSV